MCYFLSIFKANNFLLSTQSGEVLALFSLNMSNLIFYTAAD